VKQVLQTGTVPFRLDGKFAVVTGGASGIGKAIAERFAASGARLCILDVDLTEARAVADRITAPGAEASVVACDVSNHQQVKEVFQEIFRREKLDILVNNAGIAHVGRLETTPEADFDRILRVNVKGVYNCMHACIEHMKGHGGGVILNMASIAGTMGIADRFAYSTSKGAVVAMTYSVAKDYLSHNIRCNCISPARIHTPFVDGFLRKNYPGHELEMFARLSAAQPVGRMGEPAEVALLALYLCSDEASFLTGVDYPLDGGFVNLRG
jgi:NAD(P)-dependent dehydrogenase (short-subunit alcohol dehydrogenase family)